MNMVAMMQVLPQLLNYLDIDVTSAKDESLDWGAVAVYSCAMSCSSDEAYSEEFVYVQPALLTWLKMQVASQHVCNDTL